MIDFRLHTSITCAPIFCQFLFDFSSPQSPPVLRVRGARIRIFWFSEPGSNNNKKEESKIICCLAFFVVRYFTKLKIISFLRRFRKHVGQLTKNSKFFSKKNSTKISEIWHGDPGSRIREPGNRKKLSRILI